VHHRVSASFDAAWMKGPYSSGSTVIACLRAIFWWELPAGTVDPGEKTTADRTPPNCGRDRYRAKKWTKLAEFYPSPGFLEREDDNIPATGLTAGKATQWTTNGIATRWFTAKEIDDMIRTGKIQGRKKPRRFSQVETVFRRLSET